MTASGDPRARGFLRAWASGARLWSHTTRQLLASKGLGEAQLALVSFYLCLKEACLLVEGKRGVPGDEDALANIPIDLAEMTALRTRANAFRNEVLHLSDKSEKGRAVHISWTAEAPYFVFRSSVGDREVGEDSISRPDIEAVLDLLDPWLREHWERLIRERD